MKQPGKLWFAVQSILTLGLIAAPFVSNAGVHLQLLLLGGVLLISGLVCLILSYRALGKSHSPWTRPIDGAHLTMTGPYAAVRHPVYASYVLIGLGLELAVGSVPGVGVVVVTFVYYDLRTREEEKWLGKAYTEFDFYRRRVRGRLIPGVY